MSQVVECVPNFSEGRDMAKIKQITDAIESVGGVTLLDVDPGADTNRTVVTFIGSPAAVEEAAFQAVRTAASVLDMTTQHGAHPRMGATDVCPFVPVEGVTIDDCAEIARRLGRRVGDELAIPVYLYEAAAATPERANLAVVRKGEYEGLAAKLADPHWAPDFGPTTPHPRAGALITGAREFLIAYNVSLNTRDKALATDIAFELREKGRVARTATDSPVYARGTILRYAEGSFPCGNCGFVGASLDDTTAHCRDEHDYDLRHLLALNDVLGDDVVGQKVYRRGLFEHCKAIGWVVDEYDRAQISINLTDYHVTPPHEVLEAARSLAAERGLVVTGSEIVGLVPYAALREAGEYYLRRQGKTPGIPTRDVLATAVQSMGLGDVSPFDVSTKVLGLPRVDGPLVGMTVVDLVDEVSRETPTPGGGSVAALAGALAAGLASMVASLTQGRGAAPVLDAAMDEVAVEAQRVKAELVAAVDADTDAFASFMEARRLPAATEDERRVREQAMQDGLKVAIEVPLRTARAALVAMRLADRAARDGNPASVTDGAVGVQLGFAAVRGGVWNALTNLGDITDAAYADRVRTECAELVSTAQSLLDGTVAHVDARLA